MVAIVRLIERFSGLIGLIGAWVMLPLILSMVYEVLATFLQCTDVLGI